MPQVGNKCPGINEYHTFKSGYCLNECQRQCVPPSVLVHITNKQRVDKHQGRYISVTALLGCMRQLYLERTIDYFVEPPQNWYSVRGTLLHNILEQPTFNNKIGDLEHDLTSLVKKGELKNAEENLAKFKAIKKVLEEIAADAPGETIPDWESEVEYEFPLGIYNCNECKHVFSSPFNAQWCPECKSQDLTPWYLRGTIDVLRRGMGAIYDYKTIGDKGLGIVKRGAKKDHIAQFNFYRFMTMRGYPVAMKDDPSQYQPPDITSIKAFYMTMMQVVATGSLLTEDTGYRVSEPEVEENEVGREWLGEKVEMVLKPGKKKVTAGPDDYRESRKTNWRIVHSIPDVPLMDLDECEALIKGLAPSLIKAFVRGDMPDMCAPEMRAWKCNKFCPQQVREACDAYNDKVGVKREVEVEPLSDDIPMEVL